MQCGDVDRHRIEAVDPAVGAGVGNIVRLVVRAAAVGTDCGVSERDLLAAQRLLDVWREHRVGRLAPYFAHRAAECVADVGACRVLDVGVQKSVALVVADMGYERGQVVRHELQAALAVERRTLGQVALGHVLKGAEQAHDLSALEHPFALRSHHQAPPFGGDKRQLQIPRAAVGQRGVDRAPDQRSGFGRIELDRCGRVEFGGRVELVDAVDLFGPEHPRGREVELPAADPGERTRALQKVARTLDGPMTLQALFCSCRRGPRRLDRLLLQCLRAQTQLEQRDDLARKRLERAQLVGGEHTRYGIENTDRAERVAVGGDDRRAGIEADARLAGDQRVVVKARIERRVFDDEHRALGHDRMGAERQVAVGFGRVQTDTSFEPLSIRIEKRDQTDRRAADLRREQHDVVIEQLGQGVEHTQLAQRGHARRLIARQRGGDGRHVSRAGFGRGSSGAHDWSSGHFLYCRIGAGRHAAEVTPKNPPSLNHRHAEVHPAADTPRTSHHAANSAASTSNPPKEDKPCKASSSRHSPSPWSCRSRP